MAAPNIVNVASIIGKTVGVVVGTSPTTIVSNAAASGKVLKVNVLNISNVSDATVSWLTADIYDGATATRISYKIVMPLAASYTPILKDGSIYLVEGMSLRCTAGDAATLEAVCSYEELS